MSAAKASERAHASTPAHARHTSSESATGTIEVVVDEMSVLAGLDIATGRTYPSLGISDGAGI